MRDRSLSERKQELRRAMKRTTIHALRCSQVDGKGVALFKAACEHDLEGIVVCNGCFASLPQ